MAARPFMPFWYNDFFAFCNRAGLSLEEEAIYFRLLCFLFEAGGELPDDSKLLSKVVNVHQRTFNRCYNSTLTQFFRHSNGVITHEKVDEVLEQANLKSEKARRSSRVRWDKEQEESASQDDLPPVDDYANAMRTHEEPECERNANKAKQNKAYKTTKPSPPNVASDTSEKIGGEGGLSSDFKTLLDLYPKHSANDVDAGWPLWRTIGLTQRAKILADVRLRTGLSTPNKRFEMWYRSDGQYIPELVNYLGDRKQRYWRSSQPPNLEPFSELEEQPYDWDAPVPELVSKT